MARLWIRFVVLGAVVCLSGCLAMAAKKIDWRTDTSSTTKPAVLRCWPSLQIIEMDGSRRDLVAGDGLWFQQCDISIDPGEHTLVVRHYSTGGGPVSITTSTDNMTVKFYAEPGGIYQLKGKALKTDGAWVRNRYEVQVTPAKK